MAGVPKPVLQGVIAILGLCAVGGFVMGVSATLSRKGAAADDEQAPVASSAPANVTIKDAQPLAPPPPPPPKPKAAADAAASDQPPSDAPAKTPPTPTESPPAAPPVAAAPKATAPAKLPDDLPPT